MKAGTAGQTKRASLLARAVLGLLVFLCCSPVGSAFTKNGSVIILRSTYQLQSDQTDALIIVSTDEEIAKVSGIFAPGLGSEVVVIESRSGTYAVFEARLRWLEAEHFGGLVVSTGQPIHVVSFSYARRHHLI